MSRPFDRERDIKNSGIDSEKAFSVINKNNLDKRFGTGSRFLWKYEIYRQQAHHAIN